MKSFIKSDVMTCLDYWNYMDYFLLLRSKCECGQDLSTHPMLRTKKKKKPTWRLNRFWHSFAVLTCHKSGFKFNLSHSFLLCNKRLFKAEIAIVRYIIHGWIHVGHWLNGVQFLCINGKSPTASVRDEVDFKKRKNVFLREVLNQLVTSATLSQFELMSWWIL